LLRLERRKKRTHKGLAIRLVKGARRKGSQRAGIQEKTMNITTETTDAIAAVKAQLPGFPVWREGKKTDALC
jgi:hypothetical protein